MSDGNSEGISSSNARNPYRGPQTEGTGGNSEGISSSNAQRLLWAGFMAILAAGVGFSVRGAILGQWADRYGFTMTELGQITGGGFVGAGLIILAGSFIADKVGYGKLMALAFLAHFSSAVLTLATGTVYASAGKDAAFYCLYFGMFLFAVGNGICEAVVNPLVATLFPANKSHYLNILHAGWPGGLIIGGLIAYFMNPDKQEPVHCMIQLSLFLMCFTESCSSDRSFRNRKRVTLGSVMV